MNRTQFQILSKLRVREAEVLLEAGLPAGAYYLAGYAVECALKACVAKQVKEHDFPDRKLALDAYTHDLAKLLRVAGLEKWLEETFKERRALAVNWSIIKDWTESARYEEEIGVAKARELYAACSGAPNGVLLWIRERW